MSRPRPLKHGSLCTGYGGLDMAAQAVFGGELAWWSDIEPGPIAVMQHHHPGVPNLGDIKTIDWTAVSGVDLLTAGYPCQPFSNAGLRLGTEDPRHLWPWIAQGIGVLRPRIIILENVAGHLRRGFDVVTADLAALGYDTAWSVVRASDVGAPHRRERLFVVAQDPDRAAGGEWGESASGQAEGGRAWADAGRRGGAPAAGSGVTLLPTPSASRYGNNRGGAAGRVGPIRPSLDSLAQVLPLSEALTQDWLQYEPAIRRWENILGRLAPLPTEPSPRARLGRVLTPGFPEWMMGLPAGYVTAMEGLTRNQMLKLLGNGVVPQQAEYAIRGLYDQLLAGVERAA